MSTSRHSEQTGQTITEARSSAGRGRIIEHRGIGGTVSRTEAYTARSRRPQTRGGAVSAVGIVVHLPSSDRRPGR